jgi:hypothetical protein
LPLLDLHFAGREAISPTLGKFAAMASGAAAAD